MQSHAREADVHSAVAYGEIRQLRALLDSGAVLDVNRYGPDGLVLYLTPVTAWKNISGVHFQYRHLRFSSDPGSQWCTLRSHTVTSGLRIVNMLLSF
eukprot:1294082-Amphidinium_carterae.1